MIVVADTGPLISLGHIKRLDILEQLYPDYIIAQAVYQELVNYKRIDFDELDLLNIRKHIRTINFEFDLSLAGLGLGEAESISLLKALNGRPSLRMIWRPEGLLNLCIFLVSERWPYYCKQNQTV